MSGGEWSRSCLQRRSVIDRRPVGQIDVSLNLEGRSRLLRSPMENKLDNGSPRCPRTGMAAASLVLGIISIPTLGLALAGAVVGIILGSIALRNANRDPVTFGGRGVAIAGIVTSCVSIAVAVLMVVVATVAIPNLVKSAQADREFDAIQSVKTISQAQVLYSVTKGRGRFTDLRTLAAAGLIEPMLGSGERGGYRFSSTPVVAEGRPAMFDTTAWPISIGSFGTGNRSFYSNETVVIWEAEGENPPQASPSDRTPKQGSLLIEPRMNLMDWRRHR